MDTIMMVVRLSRCYFPPFLSKRSNVFLKRGSAVGKNNNLQGGSIAKKEGGVPGP